MTLLWAVAGAGLPGLSAVSPALLVPFALLLFCGGIRGGSPVKFAASQFGTYATDQSLETDGVRVRLEADSPTWFLVARSGGANRAYDRVVQKNSRRYQKQLQRGLLDNETAENEIIKPAFIECCMLDWGGVTGEDGKEIPFSRKACEDLFAEYPDVYDVLREQAGELATYRIREQEEVAERLGES